MESDEDLGEIMDMATDWKADTAVGHARRGYSGDLVKFVPLYVEEKRELSFHNLIKMTLSELV